MITGASSGIGLTTARMAAKRGARLVLAARSDETLERICSEIGPNATYVRADVGHEEDMRESRGAGAPPLRLIRYLGE